jgi:hypothetical protein
VSITNELKRVYASAPFDRRFVETLQLTHPLFPSTYLLNNDGQAWQFLLNAGDPPNAAVTFLPVPFKLVLPTQDGKGQQDLQMVLDNVGREAMDAIEAAAANPTINIALTYRVYLDIPLTPPQSTPPLELALQSVVITVDSIVGTATRADVLNKPFPSELYRVDLFPGLNR